MKNSKDLKNSLKSSIGENNRFTGTISVFLLILIMSGLFAFIITGLYRFDLFEFPEFIQNIFIKPETGGEDPLKDDKNVYEFLREYGETADNGGDGFVPEITLENIRDVIGRLKFPDNLHLETSANYYAQGKISKTEKISLWKKGGKYKYTLTVNSAPEESYITDGQNEFIENFITGDKIKRSAPKTFSFDGVPHIADINHYLMLADSGEISELTVLQSNDSNIARIEYSVPELNQRESIDISLDTGIVLKLVCRIGESGEIYYESATAVLEAYNDGDALSEERTSIQDFLFEIK